MEDKNLMVDKIYDIIDLWASNAVINNTDGASAYNPYNGQELAEAIYEGLYGKSNNGDK